MTEVQHNSYYAFEGNLNTPLGYMSKRTSWENFLRVLDLATLPAMCSGTIVEHDISPFLFPFTTIEIHPGYMLGEERIIATHSGNYGWHKTRSLARVRFFNSAGKLTGKDFPTSIGNEAKVKVELNTKEAVVLERIPVSFEPESDTDQNWNAEITGITYSGSSVSLSLTAPNGGVLRIGDGEFGLHTGANIVIKLDDKSFTRKVTGHELKIIIPVNFSGKIIIEPEA